MNRKFTSGQENQIGKIAKDAMVSLSLSFEAAQRLVSNPQLAPRLKALFAELLVQQPPCLVYAPDLIPQWWEVAVVDGVAQDIAPSKFKVGDRKFKSFLKGGEDWVNGPTMRQRAVELKGSLGLSDAKYFLEHQSEIPKELRGKYIVFAGTLLRDSDGYFLVACLRWRGGRWVLRFGWLDSGWYGRGLVACSE